VAAQMQKRKPRIMHRSLCDRLAFLCLIIALVGCEQPPQIAAMLADIEKHNGKVVRVSGRVESVLDWAGNGWYWVDDGSGRIVVITKIGECPSVGRTVNVEGTFQRNQIAWFRDRATPAVIFESSRKVD
jgi:hypothetical protein